MKIALIGNMNNNNFALMRYFRMLGVDAHLLLYSNDGKGELSHFKPECDTWNIEKWQPYIHQTNIPNIPVAGLCFPLSWLVAFRSIFLTLLGCKGEWNLPVSNREIKKCYTGYDSYIGSGITPATFARANLILDIFYPYAIGVEFFSDPEFLRKLSKNTFFRNWLTNSVRKWQSKGIIEARHTLSIECGNTFDTLSRLPISPLKLSIPMVFNQEDILTSNINIKIEYVLKLIKKSNFVIMHHARLIWKKSNFISKENWKNINKNNNWLIESFSDFVENRRDLNPILILFEYGPDVNSTKNLVNEFGLNQYVVWLPIMDRRELMCIIPHISVGVGEFYEIPKMIWGGTGWEVLASGKPLLQGFNFEPGEFEQNYGYPPPPMLPVRNQEDILGHLLEMADHPAKREDIGQRAKAWFDEYNGVGLAKKWLELLRKEGSLEGKAKIKNTQGTGA
jgi:hypothetical protein